MRCASCTLNSIRTYLERHLALPTFTVRQVKNHLSRILAMLRFDGLYISKLPVDYGAMLSYSYLRFYDDGVVIECTVQGDRLTPSFDL
jgi:hypothetical protein